jgi:hypothetical protein
VLAVPKNTQADLAVSASDPDGDALTLTWQITRGTLTAQNPEKTVMRWLAPAEAGLYTVVIAASDGTESTTLTVTISAGTRITSLPSSCTKVNSPYILTTSANPPTMIVAGLDSVTVEPGVEWLIGTPDMEIRVLGELDAHGTVDEPIVIRPNNRTYTCTMSPKWWEGISGFSDDAVSSDGLVDFEYVRVWNANRGVRLADRSRAVLRNCEVLCSGEAGVHIEGSGWLRAIDTRITDGLNDGIAIAALSSLPDSVRIQGCNLSFNGNAGIRMDLDDASQHVPITVEYNQIEFNGAYGISLANAVFPEIHYNAFRGNGDTSVANLFLVSGYPDPVNLPELDATCNYWGAPNMTQALVNAGIRDQLDTSLVHAYVKSCPWLNASPITTPPDCSMVCP